MMLSDDFIGTILNRKLDKQFGNSTTRGKLANVAMKKAGADAIHACFLRFSSAAETRA
jgi:hypothetical protein